MDVKFDNTICKVKFGFLHPGDVFVEDICIEDSSNRSTYMKMCMDNSDCNAVDVCTGVQYHFSNNAAVVQLDACLNVKLKRI